LKKLYPLFYHIFSLCTVLEINGVSAVFEEGRSSIFKAILQSSI